MAEDNIIKESAIHPTLMNLNSVKSATLSCMC